MTAHDVTAAAYYLIGFVLIELAIRVYNTPPINRAFLFGPYVTPEGIKALLHSWVGVLLFGLFIFSCAIEHSLDDHMPAGTQATWSWIEAGISSVTAGWVAYRRFLLWRLWRRG